VIVGLTMQLSVDDVERAVVGYRQRIPPSHAQVMYDSLGQTVRASAGDAVLLVICRIDTPLRIR
jgi:hypothetical protein